MMELMGPMRGTTPSGMDSSIEESRSDTIWRARKISVLQSNVTYRNERPADDTERTVSTPGSPFIVVSSGNVMSCSTSSAAIPPASVMMVTVGLFRSGNTSTGVWARVQAP